MHCYSGDEDRDAGICPNALRQQSERRSLHDRMHRDHDLHATSKANIAWSVKRMYTEAYNRYAVGTTYWNLALDPSGTIHNGGCGNCTGLISVPITGASDVFAYRRSRRLRHRPFQPHDRPSARDADRRDSIELRSSASSRFSTPTGASRSSSTTTAAPTRRNHSVARQSRFRVPLAGQSLTTISFDMHPSRRMT
ncbi:MAG: hypothetical protein MZU97_24665 [Bacillus subtilis]|nr:hypothetical protein [Bacillus subtilis]